MNEGLVMKSTGSWYTVKEETGNLIECRIRGKIRLKGVEVTNPVAVGDWVKYELEGDGKGIISDVLPRENYLIRKSTRKSRFGHILAANIDQTVLVATITFPRTSLGFIDRFLVAAESFRIPQVLVFNKSDLFNDVVQEGVDELREIYTSIGVEFLQISAEKEENLEGLKKLLEGKKSLFAGHSGVGKSTILNKLSPSRINQTIGEVSKFANKGVHTTTFAEMFEIDKETYVIDTPGIKELGLMDIDDGEISHFFPEMRDRFGACRFHNCQHVREPGCAIIEAVERGEIAESRFRSYLSILEDDDSHR